MAKTQATEKWLSFLKGILDNSVYSMTEAWNVKHKFITEFNKVGCNSVAKIFMCIVISLIVNLRY